MFLDFTFHSNEEELFKVTPDLIEALAIRFVLLPVALLMVHSTIVDRLAPTALQYGRSSTNGTL